MKFKQNHEKVPFYDSLEKPIFRKNLCPKENNYPRVVEQDAKGYTNFEKLDFPDQGYYVLKFLG